MGEQRIRYDLAVAAQGVERAAEIDGIPQDDGGRDQGEAADAVRRQLGGAVAQAAEAVEAHRMRERVARLTFF
jgi:hypothetical protein